MVLEKYIHESSGWILRRVKHLGVHTVLYKPLGGSSYLELPKTLINSHSLLHIKNGDDKCFVWAILANIHQVTESADEVHHYTPYECDLNMKGIDFPVSLSKLNQFAKQNEAFSVNVFGYENNEIYPLRITRQKGRKHHVNLLYLQKGDLSHYCLIRNLNRFLSRTKSCRNVTYFCDFCLHGYIRVDLMLKHREFCAVNGEQKLFFHRKVLMTY